MEASGAASVATSLIFTGLGLQSSRAQERLDLSRNAYETESARLATSEMAYESTRQFRQALGTQIATAGARGAGSSLMQFTTESYANYLADQSSIGRKAEAARISGVLGESEARGARFSRDLGLLAGFSNTLLGLTNLNSAPASATSRGGNIAKIAAGA